MWYEKCEVKVYIFGWVICEMRNVTFCVKRELNFFEKLAPVTEKGGIGDSGRDCLIWVEGSPFSEPPSFVIRYGETHLLPFFVAHISIALNILLSWPITQPNEHNLPKRAPCSNNVMNKQGQSNLSRIAFQVLPADITVTIKLFVIEYFHSPNNFNAIFFLSFHSLMKGPFSNYRALKNVNKSKNCSSLEGWNFVNVCKTPPGKSKCREGEGIRIPRVHLLPTESHTRFAYCNTRFPLPPWIYGTSVLARPQKLQWQVERMLSPT